jgi:hypothetical protein
MQRHAVVVLAILALYVAGCGSDKKPTTPTAAKITITPANPSLEVGRFLALTATITDASGNTVTNLTPTWSSSNTAIVDVSTNGAICAGKWNSTTTPTICTPGSVGTAVVTATAGGVSGSVTVYAHAHIARLELSTATAGCTSQGQTQTFTAKALDSNNVDIGSTTGPPTFSVSDSTVGTIDVNGIVTAGVPGAMQVNASLSGTNALPAPFVTCPPAEISISQQGNPAVTDFTLATTQTATLTAAVADTKGNLITNIPVTFSSSAPGVATVTTSAFTGTVTASQPGRVGIIASCTPPACSPGINHPIYSNVVTVTVTGASSPKVVAASTNSSSVAIIDSTNTVAATVTVPNVTVNGTAKTPILNSVVMAGDGSKAFFGSDTGVLILDMNSNAFLTTVFLFSGKVLAASADGAKFAVTNGTVLTVADTASTATNTYPIAGATAADLSQDAIKLFAVSGATLNGVNRTGTAVTTTPLAAAATDVKFLPQGSVAFVAEPGASTQLFATCDNSSRGSVAAQPHLLASADDSSRMFGANTTTVFSIASTITPPATPISDPTLQINTCAPQVSTSVASAALGATVTPRQVIAAPNASRAVVLGDTTSIFSYNNVTNSVTAIPLSGGGTSTTGGITPDSALLYVGTTNGDVQKIDLASGVVVQSIPAGLKNGAGAATFPDLVAVRPK